LLAEVLGSLDLRHEADEHAVPHHLGLKPGRAVGVPIGFPPARQRHAHPELANADPRHVAVDATLAQGVDHPPGPVLVHPVKLP